MPQTIQPSNKATLQWLIVLFLVGIVAAGLLAYALSKTDDKAQIQPTPSPTPAMETPSSSPEASPSPTPSPIKTYKIQNMNIEVQKEGTGALAKKGDLVTVNYTGWLENGTKFDSSLNPGREPFQFTLGQNKVIQGWELGVVGMKAGEKRKLTIPSDLGYGASGAGSIIPPNATLIFEVELLKIN